MKARRRHSSLITLVLRVVGLFTVTAVTQAPRVHFCIIIRYSGDIIHPLFLSWLSYNTAVVDLSDVRLTFDVYLTTYCRHGRACKIGCTCNSKPMRHGMAREVILYCARVCYKVSQFFLPKLDGRAARSKRAREQPVHFCTSLYISCDKTLDKSAK